MIYEIVKFGAKSLRRANLNSSSWDSNLGPMIFVMSYCIYMSDFVQFSGITWSSIDAMVYFFMVFECSFPPHVSFNLSVEIKIEIRDTSRNFFFVVKL